ncbi:MAG: hypothetical protein HRF49_07675 [bacterium]|jgi:hypothetical protein
MKFWAAFRKIRDAAFREFLDGVLWLFDFWFKPEIKQLREYAWQIVQQAEKRPGKGIAKFNWVKDQLELYVNARLKELKNPAYWINFVIEYSVGRLKSGGGNG